jgi:hypothetical protein
LFGEWCYARHTVSYDALPDHFLGFDVYDREAARFYCVERRDATLTEVLTVPIPRVFAGTLVNLDSLQALLGQSAVGSGPAEGLYVRLDRDGWLERRAKLVRPEFVQAISEHWTRQALTANQLAVRTP